MEGIDDGVPAADLPVITRRQSATLTRRDSSARWSPKDVDAQAQMLYKGNLAQRIRFVDAVCTRLSKSSSVFSVALGSAPNKARRAVLEDYRFNGCVAIVRGFEEKLSHKFANMLNLEELLDLREALRSCGPYFTPYDSLADELSSFEFLINQRILILVNSSIRVFLEEYEAHRKLVAEHRAMHNADVDPELMPCVAANLAELNGTRIPTTTFATWLRVFEKWREHRIEELMSMYGPAGFYGDCQYIYELIQGYKDMLELDWSEILIDVRVCVKKIIRDLNRTITSLEDAHSSINDELICFNLGSLPVATRMHNLAAASKSFTTFPLRVPDYNVQGGVISLKSAEDLDAYIAEVDRYVIPPMPFDAPCIGPCGGTVTLHIRSQFLTMGKAYDDLAAGLTNVQRDIRLVERTAVRVLLLIESTLRETNSLPSPRKLELFPGKKPSGAAASPRTQGKLATNYSNARDNNNLEAYVQSYVGGDKQWSESGSGSHDKGKGDAVDVPAAKAGGGGAAAPGFPLRESPPTTTYVPARPLVDLAPGSPLSMRRSGSSSGTSDSTSDSDSESESEDILPGADPLLGVVVDVTPLEEGAPIRGRSGVMMNGAKMKRPSKKPKVEEEVAELDESLVDEMDDSITREVPIVGEDGVPVHETEGNADDDEEEDDMLNDKFGGNIVRVGSVGTVVGGRIRPFTPPVKRKSVVDVDVDGDVGVDTEEPTSEHSGGSGGLTIGIDAGEMNGVDGVGEEPTTPRPDTPNTPASELISPKPGRPVQLGSSSSGEGADADEATPFSEKGVNEAGSYEGSGDEDDGDTTAGGVYGGAISANESSGGVAEDGEYVVVDDEDEGGGSSAHA